MELNDFDRARAEKFEALFDQSSEIALRKFREIYEHVKEAYPELVDKEIVETARALYEFTLVPLVSQE